MSWYANVGTPAGVSSSAVVTTASQPARRAPRRMARAVSARFRRPYFHGVSVGAWRARRRTFPATGRWASMGTTSTGWRVRAACRLPGMRDHVVARGVHHEHANPRRNGATRVASSRLDGQAAAVVAAGEERAGAVPGEVLVDGAAGALPVAVVVDEDDPARTQTGVEVLELVARRLVPVGVETKHGDLARHRGRQSVLHP